MHGLITSMQHQATQTQWKKPQMDFVKANFDGAIFPSEGFSGIRVVVRDGAGDFIAGYFSPGCDRNLCSEICN